MKIQNLLRTITLAALAFAYNGLAQAPFSFAAIGDAPYEPVSNGRQVYPVPLYERLIAHINSDPMIPMISSPPKIPSRIRAMRLYPFNEAIISRPSLLPATLFGARIRPPPAVSSWSP